MRVRALAVPAIVLACALTSTAVAQSKTDTLPPASPWSAKPTGTYEIELGMPNSADAASLMPNGPLAATVTIKDSTGALKATFWKRGDNDGHDMTVTTQGTDLILDAQTPRGALRITLQQHGAALTGSWSLAGAGGAVKGRKTS